MRLDYWNEFPRVRFRVRLKSVEMTRTDQDDAADQFDRHDFVDTVKARGPAVSFLENTSRH
jgi:hypothetical protein